MTFKGPECPPAAWCYTHKAWDAHWPALGKSQSYWLHATALHYPFDLTWHSTHTHTHTHTQHQRIHHMGRCPLWHNMNLYKALLISGEPWNKHCNIIMAHNSLAWAAETVWDVLYLLVSVTQHFDPVLLPQKRKYRCLINYKCVIMK